MGVGVGWVDRCCISRRRFFSLTEHSFCFLGKKKKTLVILTCIYFYSIGMDHYSCKVWKTCRQLLYFQKSLSFLMCKLCASFFVNRVPPSTSGCLALIMGKRGGNDFIPVTRHDSQAALMFSLDGEG